LRWRPVRDGHDRDRRRASEARRSLVPFFRTIDYDAGSKGSRDPPASQDYILPSTQIFQPTATGFFVYDAFIGTVTLPSNAGASDNDLLTLNKGLLQGSYVVAFTIEPDGSIGATSNSGAIFETGTPPAILETSTWAMLLLGFAGLGFAGYRKAHNARTAPSAI
jgi:hypothetical protein